ncbi:MAG: T9SS type A sorting domain-containing protein [Chitinophagales bacterium]
MKNKSPLHQCLLKGTLMFHNQHSMISNTSQVSPATDIDASKFVKTVLILILTSLVVVTNLSAQEIFRLDFESELAPEDWSVSSKAEWGHLIGEDGSDYFRFSSSYTFDLFDSPALTLDEGNYVLYFSWNETGDINPDFVNVRIKKGNGSWEEVYDFGGLEGGATNREWRKDSAVIGNLETAEYTIQFQYKSTGKYPSQYIGLDNVFLVKSDLVTSLQPTLERIDFSIYPNPVKSILSFNVFDLENRNFEAKILNVNGQLLKTLPLINANGQNTIDVSDLARGTYLLELVNQEGVKTESFVIQ